MIDFKSLVNVKVDVGDFVVFTKPSVHFIDGPPWARTIYPVTIT